MGPGLRPGPLPGVGASLCAGAAASAGWLPGLSVLRSPALLSFPPPFPVLNLNRCPFGYVVSVSASFWFSLKQITAAKTIRWHCFFDPLLPVCVKEKRVGGGAQGHPAPSSSAVPKSGNLLSSRLLPIFLVL